MIVLAIKHQKEILEQGMLSDNIYVNKETMQILLNIDLKKGTRFVASSA